MIISNIINILKIKKFHQRGFYEVLTAICFFTGLILLPVAEVYTLLMTNPLFVTLFARLKSHWICFYDC